MMLPDFGTEKAANKADTRFESRNFTGKKDIFPAFEGETRTDMRRMIFRFQPNDLPFS